jgi:hypothetical protein
MWGSGIILLDDKSKFFMEGNLIKPRNQKMFYIIMYRQMTDEETQIFTPT